MQILLYILTGLLVLVSAALLAIIIKLLKQMATFAELQTSTQALTAATQALTIAINTHQANHMGDITALQADAIVLDINNATVALNQAAAILVP
jgi:hypothetical protein